MRAEKPARFSFRQPLPDAKRACVFDRERRSVLKERQRKMHPPDSTPERLRAALNYKAPAPKEKPRPEPASAAQCAKASFSIFPADNERITAIRTALAGQGRKISASHAVRLALRAVEIDARKLAKILDAMQAEDGRTRRHQ